MREHRRPAARRRACRPSHGSRCSPTSRSVPSAATSGWRTCQREAHGRRRVRVLWRQLEREIGIWHPCRTRLAGTGCRRAATSTTASRTRRSARARGPGSRRARLPRLLGGQGSREAVTIAAVWWPLASRSRRQIEHFEVPRRRRRRCARRDRRRRELDRRRGRDSSQPWATRAQRLPRRRCASRRRRRRRAPDAGSMRGGCILVGRGRNARRRDGGLRGGGAAGRAGGARGHGRPARLGARLRLESSYEFPGRHARWTMGFVNPPLVLEAWGHTFTVTALNPRGGVLLPAMREVLQAQPSVSELQSEGSSLRGRVREIEGRFAEEERSRQHSIFSVVRALCELMGVDDDPQLGLYGAFGYDLTFQFEQVPLTQQRDANQRDLLLYLPDEILVIDILGERVVAAQVRLHGGRRVERRAAADGRAAAVCAEGGGRPAAAARPRGRRFCAEGGNREGGVQGAAQLGAQFGAISAQFARNSLTGHTASFPRWATLRGGALADLLRAVPGAAVRGVPGASASATRRRTASSSTSAPPSTSSAPLPRCLCASSATPRGGAARRARSRARSAAAATRWKTPSGSSRSCRTRRRSRSSRCAPTSTATTRVGSAAPARSR